MASKKDSDNEESLQREEELSSLQNEFLTMTLVPKEYSDIEELPMSPAVVTEGLSEPFVPLPRKKKPGEDRETEPLKDYATPQREVESPAPKPKQQSDLGASAFLLMGTVPKKESDEKQSAQKLSFKAENESESEPFQTKGEESSVPVEAPQLNPFQSTEDSESAKTSIEPKPDTQEELERASTANSSAIEPKPDIQEELERASTANSSAPDSMPQLEQKEGEEEGKSEGEKGGVFSKARSLFSTITKKDKK